MDTTRELINSEYLEMSFWEQMVQKFWQLAVTKGIEVGIAILIIATQRTIKWYKTRKQRKLHEADIHDYGI